MKKMTEVSPDIIPLAFLGGVLTGAATAILGYHLARYANQREYERQMKAHIERNSVVKVPKGRAFDRLLKQLLKDN